MANTYLIFVNGQRNLDTAERQYNEYIACSIATRIHAETGCPVMVEHEGRAVLELPQVEMSVVKNVEAESDFDRLMRG